MNSVLTFMILDLYQIDIQSRKFLQVASIYIQYKSSKSLLWLKSCNDKGMQVSQSYLAKDQKM